MSINVLDLLKSKQDGKAAAPAAAPVAKVVKVSKPAAKAVPRERT